MANIDPKVNPQSCAKEVFMMNHQGSFKMLCEVCQPNLADIFIHELKCQSDGVARADNWW